MMEMKMGVDEAEAQQIARQVLELMGEINARPVDGVVGIATALLRGMQMLTLAVPTREHRQQNKEQNLRLLRGLVQKIEAVDCADDQVWLGLMADEPEMELRVH